MTDFILFVIVSLLIIVLLLKWSRIFDIIIRTAAGIMLILLFVNLMPVIFSDYMEIDEGTPVMIYEKPSLHAHYDTATIPRFHLLAKQSGGFYRYLAVDAGIRTGYIYHNGNVHYMSTGKSLLMRLLLAMPVFLLIIAVFGSGYRPEFSDFSRNIAGYRDRLYIDSAVIREIKELRERIEDMKIDRESMDSMKAELKKVRDKTSDIKILDDVKLMERDLDTLIGQYGLGETFSRKLLECRDFFEEAMLRFDYYDYRVAIQLFNDNMPEMLRKMVGEDESDYSELIMTAFRRGMIDIDMKQDMLWMKNLDAAALKERLGPRDKSRARMIIERCSKQCRKEQ